MSSFVHTLLIVLCISCSGLPLLDARALHSSAAATAHGHAEDAAASMPGSMLLAVRRLQGISPVNTAQIERTEAFLKAGVVPYLQQPAQAGRRLHGVSPVNKAQIERIEANLKAGVLPNLQQPAQAGRRLHGTGPVNKAQIERIDANQQAGVLPNFQQPVAADEAAAGRRL